MRSTDLSWDEQTRADAGRLWAGGAVAAVVAAGVALVGVLVLYKLLDTFVLTPGGMREPGEDAKVVFPVAAALITLLATGLVHLLMTTTPRAPEFFGWIAGLLIALLVLQVFVGESTDQMLPKLATAAYYLLVGVAISSSLYGVARTAVRYHRHQDYRDSARPEPGYHDRRSAGYPESRHRDAYTDEYGYRDETRRYR